MVARTSWLWSLIVANLASAGVLNQHDARQADISSASPIFRPPHNDAAPSFVCDYSAMGKQWRSCSLATQRDCWLTDGKTKYDVNTDYEKKWPTGITRRYTLDIATGVLSGDGFRVTDGQLFNQTYPGPHVMACWGDKLEITVTNRLKFNGTSIHWHGLRQLNTNYADGVNGVTQCPITGSPNPDTYTYKFTVTEYGTSWYHSHYSLQYANGLLGPITIFGPSSANWDNTIDPLLMTDNVHQNAFSLYYLEPGVVNGVAIGPPKQNNILLNGIGQYQCTPAELSSGVCVQQNYRFNTTFVPGKKYFLRLINTSVATSFIFSIDNHDITVMSTDFVPIKPYVTNKVNVGIGQRYHIIVEAKPSDGRTDRNYWMRTVPADGCANWAGPVPQNTTGILFYSGNAKTLPNSTPNKYSTACADEPYNKLVPVVPRQVQAPASPNDISEFNIYLIPPPGNTVRPRPDNGTAHWHLGNQTLFLDLNDPTIQHYNQGKKDWPPWWVVVPEETPADQWIYMMVTSANPNTNATKNNIFPAIVHPMHLHGHDFVILSQSSQPYQPGVTPLNLKNPPRRDVVQLPGGGHIVIAFRADNPGSWLFHCHIAWHVSNGLAIQILERDGSINYPKSQASEVDRVCKNWNNWYSDRNNWYNPAIFQDDSGV